MVEQCSPSMRHLCKPMQPEPRGGGVHALLLSFPCMQAFNRADMDQAELYMCLLKLYEEVMYGTRHIRHIRPPPFR